MFWDTPDPAYSIVVEPREYVGHRASNPMVGKALPSRCSGACASVPVPNLSHALGAIQRQHDSRGL